MFACRVCDEKEKRIADLKAEIITLRRIAMPSGVGALPVINLEADRILSGADDVMTLSDDEVQAEAEALLSGAY